ncbi:MAG: DNA-binding protein [Lachnospirales bacterium]
MVKQNFITPNEVAIELGISKSYAYKITRELNNELKAKGFITIAGKVSRVYFEEKFYGYKEVSSANL